MGILRCSRAWIECSGIAPLILAVLSEWVDLPPCISKCLCDWFVFVEIYGCDGDPIMATSEFDKLYGFRWCCS